MSYLFGSELEAVGSQAAAPAEAVDLFGNAVATAVKPARRPAPRPKPDGAERPAALPPAGEAFGAVTPMLTAQGNPFPMALRRQQVGLRVVKAVVARIDAALAGGPIRLNSVVLGPAGKALVKRLLLERLFPDLYADPVPADVTPRAAIRSPKAVRYIEDRLQAVFAAGEVALPGVTLGSKDCYELLQLLQGEILAEEHAAGFSTDGLT